MTREEREAIETSERDRDERLRKDAVNLAITFLKERQTGDIKAAKDIFIDLYKSIHNFISNKPGLN